MPNNVYIGSRYVPIFDGDWDSSKNYEALTIVLYSGSSYTSKKPVPAGTLPTDASYWALTGNYNGQISYLQSQINTINNTDLPAIRNDITTLGNKTNDILSDHRNIILIGDSYLAGGLGFNTYGSKLAALMSNDNIYQYPESGSGFCHTGVNGNTFEFLLDSAISAHTSDANDITDVIAIGGSNDIQQTDALMSTRLAAFVTKANNAFPNAKVRIGFFAWTDGSIDSSNKLQFIRTQEQYLRLGANNKMLYIKGLENFAHNYAEFYNAGHPAEACHDKVARYLLDYLKTGSAEMYEEGSNTFTPTSGFTADVYIGGASINAMRKDDMTEIYVNGAYTLNSWGAFGYTFAAGTISSGGTLIGLGKIADGLIWGPDFTSYGKAPATQSAVAWFYDGTSWTPVSGTIGIMNGQLVFGPAQGVTDFSRFTGIRLPATKIVVNSLYC